MSEIFGLFLLLALGFKSLYSVWFPSHPRWRKSDIGLSFDGLEREEGAAALRKVIKMERSRSKAAVAELERERECSATAAKEAMAMIQRLQAEKSSIHMEFNQYRRLAEAKRAHDEELIRSLECLLARYEADLFTAATAQMPQHLPIDY